MSRVLVTGGGGFIGHPTLEALRRRGHEVHAVSRHPQASPGDVTWHTGDLLQPGAAAELIERVRPAMLVHLAWYAEHGKFWDSPENERWVTASKGLLEAFVAAGGRRAVLAGSCVEYDWSEGGVFAEDHPLHPAPPYGRAKLELSRAAQALADRAGLELAWARLFFLFGPREHPERLVSSVARRILAGEEAPVSEGSQVRDFIYVLDAAEALAELLDSRVNGAVNVASGIPTAVGDLVDMVAEQAGRPELVKRGAIPMREGDPPVLVADVTRLTDEVGWSPPESLDHGIERTVAWWRERIPVKMRQPPAR